MLMEFDNPYLGTPCIKKANLIFLCTNISRISRLFLFLTVVINYILFVIQWRIYFSEL